MPDSMEPVAVRVPHHVPTLLDLADEAVAAASGPSVGDDDNAAVALGPSVGDDDRRATNLGPCVGDDTPPSLGPSVGDDGGEPSDRRRKSDIRRVDSTAFGLPLYDFRYVGGKEVYRGVMAQDVLAVMPDAVVTGRDGYLRVRYGMLGIGMQRIA